MAIDYRCEDREFVSEFRSKSIGDTIQVLTTSVTKIGSSPTNRKNTTVQARVAFEDTAFNSWFEIVSSKTGCRVAALHFQQLSGDIMSSLG